LYVPFHPADGIKRLLRTIGVGTVFASTIFAGFSTEVSVSIVGDVGMTEDIGEKVKSRDM
jgi:hypothetical protein